MPTYVSHTPYEFGVNNFQLGNWRWYIHSLFFYICVVHLMHLSRRQNAGKKILSIATILCFIAHLSHAQIALNNVQGFIPCQSDIPSPTTCTGGVPPGALTNIKVRGEISFSKTASTVFMSAWTLVPPENSDSASLTSCEVGKTCQLIDVNASVTIRMTSPRIAYTLDHAIGVLPYGIALVNYSVANGRSSKIANPSIFTSTENMTCGGLSGIEMATNGGMCSSTYPLSEMTAQVIADGGWCGVNPYVQALSGANNPFGVNAFNNGPDCASGALCYACPGSASASTVYRPMAFGRMCTVYPIGSNPTFLVDIEAIVTTKNLLGVEKIWTINVASINMNGGPVVNVSNAGNLRITVDVTGTADVIQTLPGYIIICTPPGGTGDPSVTGIMGPSNTQINTRGYVPTFKWNAQPSVKIEGSWQYWAPTTFSSLVSNTGECGRLTMLTTLEQPTPATTHDLYVSESSVNQSCSSGFIQAGACIPGFVDTTQPATPCQIDTFNQRYSEEYLASTITRPTLSPFLIPDWNSEHPQYSLDYLSNGKIILAKNLMSGAQGNVAVADVILNIPTTVVPYNVVDNNTIIVNKTGTLCSYTTNAESGFFSVQVCQLGTIPLTRINITVSDCPEILTFVTYENSTWGISTEGNVTTYTNRIAINKTNGGVSCITTPPSYFNISNSSSIFRSVSGGTFGSCKVTINGLLTTSSGAWVNWEQHQTVGCTGVYLPPPTLNQDDTDPWVLPTWISALAVGIGIAAAVIFVIILVIIIWVEAKKSKSADKIKND